MVRSAYLISFLWCSCIIIIFLGCAKRNPYYIPANAVDSFVKDLNGSVYMASYSLYKLNVRTGAIEWTANNDLLFDSYSSPMYFDSGYLYYGGLYGIAAYNYESGQRIWLGNTPATAGLGGYAGYRGLAIKDSLAIYAGSSGAGYGEAHMYCVRKKNGTLVWQNTVDSAGYLSDFTSIPYIAAGNIVTLTRNYNGDFQITAYDPVTGNRVWATASNDNLQPRFLIGNNAIFVINKQYAYCYSAIDGSQLWAKDLGYYGNSTANCFLDGNKLVIANTASQPACSANVYNTTDGSLLSNYSFELSGADLTFNYGNNVLYATVIELQDTVRLHAYDLNSPKESWSYRYKIAQEYGNIVTPDFVIIPEIDSSEQCYITFLNVKNGSVVNKSFSPSNGVDQLLYVDSTGVIFRQP